jgi:hypothetical protein
VCRASADFTHRCELQLVARSAEKPDLAVLIERHPVSKGQLHDSCGTTARPAIQPMVNACPRCSPTTTPP